MYADGNYAKVLAAYGVHSALLVVRREEQDFPFA